MARAPGFICRSTAGLPRIKRAGKKRSKQAIVLRKVAPVHTSPNQPGRTWDSICPILAFFVEPARLLDLSPEARIDPLIVADYARGVEVLRIRDGCVRSRWLRGALKLICPDVDWSWLLSSPSA